MIVTPRHRDRYVTVGAHRLHLVEHVPLDAPDLPMVVLLHGVTGHAAVWSHVAPVLADTHRVLALDMRGFGDSQWSPVGAYATTDHADDVVGVLDALDVGAAAIVGSSWGALVGIAAATRAPGRVSRLALVDVEPSFEQGETDLFPRPRSFDSHAAAVAHERSSNPHAPDELLDLVAASGTRPAPEGLVPKHDPFFFERWPFRSDDWWSALPAIDTPTLVVHAGESFVRRDVTEAMASAMPDARHVEIAASTHVIPIDAPRALGTALVDFLMSGADA